MQPTSKSDSAKRKMIAKLSERKPRGNARKDQTKVKV